MSTIDTLVEQNMAQLKDNVYPGRGIILGMTPDGQNLVQVYWIMGRSTNSRNRIFVTENGFVKTQAFDQNKVEDPSLIIYYPARDYHNCHIISNGDQTDTIFTALQNGGSFESALQTRTFEPDAPNFTPRISGIIDLNSSRFAYQLAIIKPVAGNSEFCTHQFFNYQKALPGMGHCLHTYTGDGTPLPSFTGEPYLVQLPEGIEAIAAFYWQLLNKENKISLLVKLINLQTKQVQLRILNKQLGD
ncbi:MAG TPA: IMP cyclohydrolase [Bacillota bacterium]